MPCTGIFCVSTLSNLYDEHYLILFVLNGFKFIKASHTKICIGKASQNVIKPSGHSIVSHIILFMFVLLQTKTFKQVIGNNLLSGCFNILQYDSAH